MFDGLEVSHDFHDHLEANIGPSVVKDTEVMSRPGRLDSVMTYSVRGVVLVADFNEIRQIFIF